MAITSQTLGLLSYYEKALLDSLKMGPTSEVLKNSNKDAIRVTLEDYKHGTVSSQLVKIKEQLRNKGDVDEKYPVQVILYPYVYAAKATHQARTEEVIAIICIPALMWLNTGSLVPKENSPPFIPRRHLQPIDDNSVTIEHVDTVDAYITSKEYTATSWSENVSYADDLIAHILPPEDTITLAGKEYQRREGVVLQLPGTEFTPTSILNLYSNLLGAGNIPELPLLHKYCSLPTPNNKSGLMNLRGNLHAMKKHLGQMSETFPLSESQREAINHFYSPDNGIILGINGPPGTGKTTLLQSIVASEWVSAALKGNVPPVIVACSTNNQAVTNIIESFGKVPEIPGAVGKRWLPDVTSYGLYCASSSSKKTQDSYQRHDTFPGQIENSDYLDRAADHFIKMAESYFGGSFNDVIAVVARIKQVLGTLEAQILGVADKLIATADQNDAAIERIFSDKRTVLSELDNIQIGQNKLGTLDGKISRAKEQSSDVQTKAQLAQMEKAELTDHAVASRNIANGLEHLYLEWCQYSLGTSLWYRWFAFLSPVRDKWARGVLQFFEIHLAKDLLGDDYKRLHDVLLTQSLEECRTVITERLKQRSEASLDDSRQLQSNLKLLVERCSDYEQQVAHCHKTLLDLDMERNEAKYQVQKSEGTVRSILGVYQIITAMKEEIAISFDRIAEEKRLILEAELQKDYLMVSADLDKSIRAKLFFVATHYWEGLWLEEMQKNLAAGTAFPGSKNVTNRENQWRRYAKITPLMVSTFHMAPSNFVAWRAGTDNKPVMTPLFNYIDLLIIDEAGQVAPDVAAPTFSLAKTALVVGDLYQIEPVWSVPEVVDVGNMRRYAGESMANQYDKMDNDGHGISAAGGSVMRIAQMHSNFMSDNYTHGMFLREHRRCAKEIIEYCNDLAYHGRLIPCRAETDKRPDLPYMGWAHISGECEKVGDSRLNKVEAETIVSWIIQRRESLEQFYDKPIDEVVAIITPFKPQQSYLHRCLQRAGMGKMVAGTVHALQGAERKVIILSLVYDIQSRASKMFFDRGVSMLNVAVSRAIDSFLVFGDTRVLDQHSNSPSGKLAKRIFASSDNEITDIPFRKNMLHAAATVETVTTLQGHREALAQAFTTAQERLIVISPWIKPLAIQSDGLCELVAAAAARNVAVIIYTDHDFNKSDGSFTSAFTDAAAKLTSSGAEVRIVKRVHNKDLIVDTNTHYCGSFNWLSAVRQEDHLHSKKNTTIKLTGEHAHKSVERIVDEMEGLFADGGKTFGGSL